MNKVRTYSIVTLVVGAICAVVGGITPYIITLVNTANDGSVGIIGGADGPTAYYITSHLQLSNLAAGFFWAGLCVTLISLIYLIFSKTVEANCRIKTSAIAVGISAACASGFYSGLIWLIILAWAGKDVHPIRFPIATAVVVISLVALVVLVVLYIKARKKHRSIKGFLIDLATAIISIPMFFLLWVYWDKIISTGVFDCSC